MDQNQEEKSINLGQIDAEEVSINTGQRVIVVTEDKLRLQLIQHPHAIQSRDKWIAPLGIAVTLLLALITTDFRNMGLEAAVWEAIFVVALVLAIGWLIVTLMRRPKKPTIDHFINQLKTPE